MVLRNRKQVRCKTGRRRPRYEPASGRRGRLSSSWLRRRIRFRNNSHASASALLQRIDWFPWILAAIVLIARFATRAVPYFADGPAHLEAIRNHTFVIQPPGYWLFNRAASLFSDPALAISIFNILCSTLGVVAFYFAAKHLLQDKAMARWGAAIYGSIFYAWFSAEVHSTYASQLLFPVLTLLFFLRHTQRLGAVFSCWLLRHQHS